MGNDPNELTSQNFKSYSEMRWSDKGDEEFDGGDDVDDDPDDARRDGADDGSDFPLREGISPADISMPELFFSLSGFHLAEAKEYFFMDAPDVFRSKCSNTPKESRRGPQGRVPVGAPPGPAARGRPCPWWLASVPPFGSVTYFQK